MNISLTVINSDGFEEDHKLICNLSTERGVQKCVWNQQFGEDERLRDQKVRESLKVSSIEVEEFHDQVVYEPETLKTGQNTPYSVFTPFKRKWIENFEMDFLDIDYTYSVKLKSNLTSNIKDFNFCFNIVICWAAHFHFVAQLMQISFLPCTLLSRTTMSEKHQATVL